MNVTGGKNKYRALTLHDVLVIIAVATLCAVVLVPALIHGKQRRLRLACVNNLKQVGLAFYIAEGDSLDRFPMGYSTNVNGTKEYVAGGNAFRHFQSLSNELGNTKFLICPADNRVAASDFKTMASDNVSYFVAVDAAEEYPQMPLSGDRNLTTNGVSIPPGLAIISATNILGWSTELHRNTGNVCLSDGSVQTVPFIKLVPAQINTSNFMRLAIP